MKQLTLLIAVLLQVTVATGRTEPGIEIQNPGFEHGLRDWINKQDNGMSQAIAEARHDGELGLRVEDNQTNAGSSLYSNKFRVTAGKVYQLRFWARMISGDGVGVYIVFYDAKGKTFMETKEEELKNHLDPLTIPMKQTEWKEFILRKAAPEGAVEARIWIHSYTSSQSISEFDEFHLVELD